MDKEKRVTVRKERKKAIKLQNSSGSAVKLSMAEALRRVRNADSDS